MRSPSKKAKTEVVIATIEAVRELITQAGKPLPTAELIADVQAKHIPLRGKSMRGTLDARLRYSDQFVSILGRGWWIKDRPIPQCNGSARDASDDGMLQRFMFAVPGLQQGGVDRAPDKAAMMRYDALFTILATLRPPDTMGFQVTLDDKAHALRKQVDTLAEAMAAMPDTSTRMQASYGKWAGLFARLCLTFHLIEIADCRSWGVVQPSAGDVSVDTVERVTRFMRDIVLPHLIRADALMFKTAQTGHAQWIAGFILAHRLDRIQDRDIVRNYRALSAPECRPGPGRGHGLPGCGGLAGARGAREQSQAGLHMGG